MLILLGHLILIAPFHRFVLPAAMPCPLPLRPHFPLRRHPLYAKATLLAIAI